MGEYQGVGFHERANIPDDLFILNPFRQRMITGKRNYRYLWSRFGWAGILLTLFGLLIIGVAMPGLINEVRLATMKTDLTEAQVQDHRVSHGKSTSYYVTYGFKENGQVFSREESVSSSEYNQWSIGDYVNVTYAVEDPNTSHLGGKGIHWGSVAFVPIILIILAIIGGVTWASGRPMRLRVQRLQREGQIIFGQLKSSRGQRITRGSGKSRHTDYDVTILAQFTSPTGKKIDTQATFVRDDLKKKELPTSGSVAILYGSDSDVLLL
jgi:hypothetical protein